MTDQQPSQNAKLEQTILVYQGCQGQFYMVKDQPQKYFWTFPIKWALCHWSDSEVQSGPQHCFGCSTQGRINDVFVGYCTFCYDGIYKGSRGGRYDASSTTENTIEKLWDAFPYMKDTRLQYIGDSITAMNNTKMPTPLEIPKLRRNNSSSHKPTTNQLSLILPSLLNPDDPGIQDDTYVYKIGERLRPRDLERLAKGTFNLRTVES